MGEHVKVTQRPTFKKELCCNDKGKREVGAIWSFFFFCFTLCAETYASTFTIGGDKNQLTPFNYAELIWMGGRNVPAFAFFFNHIRHLELFADLAEPLVALPGPPASSGAYTPTTTLNNILSDSIMCFSYYQTVYMVSSK